MINFHRNKPPSDDYETSYGNDPVDPTKKLDEVMTEQTKNIPGDLWWFLEGVKKGMKANGTLPVSPYAGEPDAD
jgi:hypothetical protein